MGLLELLPLIDDCEFFIRDDEVENPGNKIMKLFDRDDVGNVENYVGCNINGDDRFTFT